MTKKISMVAALVALSVSAPLHAENIAVVETATYVMGDGDTRTAAREACVNRARSGAVQKAGTLVETDVNATTTEDQGGARSTAAARTRSRSVGIVTSEPQGEGAALDPDGRVVLTCTVRVTLDPAQVERATREAARDDGRLAAAEERIARLEMEKAALAPPPPVVAARSEGTNPPISYAPPMTPPAYAPPPPTAAPSEAMRPSISYAPPITPPAYAVPPAARRVNYAQPASYFPPPPPAVYAATRVRYYTAAPTSPASGSAFSGQLGSLLQAGGGQQQPYRFHQWRAGMAMNWRYR